MLEKTVKIKKFFSEIVEQVLPICLRYRHNFKSMNVSQKEDHTLLTDADLEIQATIIHLIQMFDTEAYIIAEETTNINNPPINKAKNIWIIDPIDGTAQFANPDSREYCIAVCKYEDSQPVASLIILPQIGHNLEPIIAEAFCQENIILINGDLYSQKNSLRTKNISCTRSKGNPPHEFEEKFIKANYKLKTSTTSQSIDLLRTACSLENYSDLPLQKFELFYRKNQKLWDGAPGFCFNVVAGNIIADKNYKSLLPLDYTLLINPTPINEEVYVCTNDILNKLKNGEHL